MNEFYSQDQIIIDGLITEGVIGVYTEERQKPQKLRLDLKLWGDLKLAAQTDQLANSIDYAAVCEQLRKHVLNSSFFLLEALAESLCALLLTKFSIQAVEIKICKVGIIEGVQSVGVCLFRKRKVV